MCALIAAGDPLSKDVCACAAGDYIMPLVAGRRSAHDCIDEKNELT